MIQTSFISMVSLLGLIMHTHSCGVNNSVFLLAALGQAIIFLPCGFFFYLLFFFSFFSSPNLSRHRLDVYHTSTHGVALVRI